MFPGLIYISNNVYLTSSFIIQHNYSNNIYELLERRLINDNDNFIDKIINGIILKQQSVYFINKLIDSLSSNNQIDDRWWTTHW